MFFVIPQEQRRREEQREISIAETCCCCIWGFGLIIFSFIMLGLTMYALDSWKSLRFNVDRIYIDDQLKNLTSRRPSSSLTKMKIDIRIANPNKNRKINIRPWDDFNKSATDGNVAMYYNTIPLGAGVMPELRLSNHETTVVRISLMGRVSIDWKEIFDDNDKGRYTFDVLIKVPLTLSLGFRTRTMESHCRVVVDKPMSIEHSMIVSESCKSRRY